MGTIAASVLIAKASEIAQDEQNVVWGTDQALGWLNEAQSVVCVRRPDAYYETKSIQLVPGTKQEITDRRLKRIVRNMGETGTDPGYAPRQVQLSMLNEFNPNWHSQAAGEIVFEYVWEESAPKQFYVNPPVTTLKNVYVEVIVIADPPVIATINDTITIDDIYQAPLVEWMCYRFFSRDSEETPNMQRAVMHVQSFDAIIGGKTISDDAVNPKILEPQG